MTASKENNQPPSVPPAVPAAAAIVDLSLPYWTPQRLGAREWLYQNAAPLGEVFDTVICLRFGPVMPARARFIAHGIREIANNLPGYLRVEVKGRAEYQDLVAAFATEWLEALQPFRQPNTGSASIPDVISIPVPIAQKIDSLVTAHQQATARVRANAEALFLAIHERSGASAASLRPIIQEWVDLFRWFVGRSKIARDNNPQRDSDIMNEEYVNNFQLFEDLLYTLIAQTKFLDVIGEVDAILDDANR